MASPTFTRTYIAPNGSLNSRLVLARSKAIGGYIFYAAGLSDGKVLRSATGGKRSRGRGLALSFAASVAREGYLQAFEGYAEH